MTIEQTNIVDILAIEKHSGSVRLVISDHLPWDANVEEHLRLLQDKLNTYLRFIESGEMTETRPDTRDRDVVISVVANHPLSPEGQEFFNAAREIVKTAGYELQFERHHA